VDSCWGVGGRKGALQEEEARLHGFFLVLPGTSVFHLCLLISEQIGAMAAEEEWMHGQLGQSRRWGQYTAVVEILSRSVPTLSDI